MRTGFTFRHEPAAAAGVVGRVERLHHHALVAARPATRRARRSAPAASVVWTRGTARSPTSASSAAWRSRERLVDQVHAVDVEHVEEPHEERIAGAGGVVAPEGAHRVLERRCGLASASTPSTSPSSTNDVGGQRAGDRDHDPGGGR